MGNQVIDHSCLCDGTLIKALRGSGEFPWLATLHANLLTSVLGK